MSILALILLSLRAASFDASPMVTLTNVPGLPKVYIFNNLNNADIHTESGAKWYKYPNWTDAVDDGSIKIPSLSLITPVIVLTR